MALVLTDSMPTLAAGTYLRIDGVRFEPVPRRRADGIWSIDPATPLRFHIYAYQSVGARATGQAPTGDAAYATTLDSLALLDVIAGTAGLRLGPAWRMREIGTQALWHALYGHLRREYPRSVDDHEERSPPCPIP